VVLGKVGGDQLNRLCKKLRNIKYSHGGKEYKTKI